jgi:hypothetical protein
MSVHHKIGMGSYSKSLELGRATIPYDFNTGVGTPTIESALPNRRYRDSTDSTTIVNTYWRKGLIP